MKELPDYLVPLILSSMIAVSIISTYYSKMVLRDYEVVYTETGLPEIDEE